MNRTVKRIVISLISAAIALFIIGLVQDSLAGTQPVASAVVTFLVIFCAVLFGAFTGSAGRIRASAGGATRSSGSTPGNSVNRTVSSSADRETGTVKWFNIKKGYGFITRDSGDDVFVHYRNIVGAGRRSISDDQRVSFVVIDGDKGLQADEVETI